MNTQTQERTRLIEMLQNVDHSPLPEGDSCIETCIGMDRILETAERVLLDSTGQLNYENVQWLEENGFKVTVPLADGFGQLAATQMWTRKGYFLI